MPRVLLDQVINTDYGQFDLTWGDGEGFGGDWGPFFAGQVNGLVGGAAADGVYINLARRSGGSRVRAVLLDVSPADDPIWEDVVEISTTVPEGVPVRWQTWAVEESGRLDLPPATYRLRVSARGRDAGDEGEFAEGVVDFYLLEFWAAPSAPDAIIRTTSENAAQWHREIGGRR